MGRIFALSLMGGYGLRTTNKLYVESYRVRVKPLISIIVFRCTRHTVINVYIGVCVIISVEVRIKNAVRIVLVNVPRHVLARIYIYI